MKGAIINPFGNDATPNPEVKNESIPNPTPESTKEEKPTEGRFYVEQTKPKSRKEQWAEYRKNKKR